MSGRSLIASPQGIKLAKLALKERNLTQRALTHELGIASWSTVNRFFSEKPIDRSIFQEICAELKLDWSEIVAVDNSTLKEESNVNAPLPIVREPSKTIEAVAKENAEVLVALFKDIRSQLPHDISNEVVANLAIAALSQSKDYLNSSQS